MAGNNTKMNISYSIRAIDKFTKTHKRLEKQLSQMERIADRIPDMKNIEVMADTSKATRNLARIEKKAESIPRRITTHVKVEYKQFRRNMDRMADAIRDFDEVAGSVAKGAFFTMLPAIVPIAGVAAGGIGAVGSAFTSAGLGAAGFATVAIPSIAKVVDANEKLKEAQEKVNQASDAEERAEALKELTALQGSYSKEQMKSVEAIQNFSKFFGEFQAKFEPQILDIFNRSLGTTQNLLTILEPAIAGVTTSVSNLIDSFNRNIEAEDMKAFFNWTGDTAGPNLENLTKAVGNFLAGFGNMMVAFDPLAQSFMNGFLNMSERFREWSNTLSESKGFQNFIAFVQEQTPVVLSLIGNMTMTLVNLGVAMEPVATKVLELTDKFFGWTAQVLENHKWVGKLIGVLTIATGAFRLLYPIISTVTSFLKLLWPVIRTTWSWIGKLGNLINKNTLKTLARFGSKLIGLSGPIGIVIAAVVELAIIIASNWDSIWAKTKEIWSNVQSWIEKKVDGAVATATIIGSFVKKVIGKFNELRDSVKERMESFVEFVKNPVESVKSWLEGIDLTSIGENMIRGLINGIGNMADALVSKAKGVVNSAVEGAKKLLGIHSPSRVFMEIGQFTGMGFINGMDKMQSRVTKASRNMSSAAVGGGVSAMSAPSYPRAVSYNSGASSSNNSDMTSLLAEIRHELKLQSRELSRQRSLTIEMDSEIVGRAVEPAVSEVQALNFKRAGRMRGHHTIRTGF